MISKRVQRRRTKGYKTPPNVKYCGRPTIWGNPASVKQYGEHKALQIFRQHIVEALCYFGEEKFIERFLKPLVGKDLSCWCSLSNKCHADVWVKILNQYQNGDKEWWHQ